MSVENGTKYVLECLLLLYVKDMTSICFFLVLVKRFLYLPLRVYALLIGGHDLSSNGIMDCIDRR